MNAPPLFDDDERPYEECVDHVQQPSMSPMNVSPSNRIGNKRLLPMKAASLIQESMNQDEGWMVCRMTEKKYFLHKSIATSNSSSSNLMTITNDGTLDQIV